MKIMYVITLADLGGAQMHLKLLVEMLKEKHDIVVVVGNDGWLIEQLKINFIRYEIVSELVREISPLKDIIAVKKINSLIKRYKPSLVHCHSSKAGIIGRLAAYLAGVPSIFTAHGWAFRGGASKKKLYIYELIEKVMAACTSKIICVSDYDKQLAIKLMPQYRDKFMLIHNGIVDNTPGSILNNSDDQNNLKLVMVARFAYPKNHKLIIDAVNKVLISGRNVSLTFIGDGPLYDEIKYYAEQKAVISQQYKFYGAINNVLDILPKYDVFVLTSFFEGLPISILEAMQQGMPIIASNVGGIKEQVISGETGFLIDDNRENDLIKYIEYIYDNRNEIERLGHNARKLYIQKFSAAQMIDKIQSVYDECANNK